MIGSVDFWNRGIDGNFNVATAERQTPAQCAHRGFAEACRQFHRTHGDERAQIGERLKQYEVLVELLEGVERRLGPAA